MIHFILIPLRDVGIDLRDDDWFKERIEIFKNYTLKSLKSQTNQNFILWITMRPQDESNPLIADLAEYLQEIGLRYIFTFNGLMYHDDKFSKGLKNRLWNFGRVIRWCWRNSWKDLIPSVRFIFQDKNGTLVDRLEKSLHVLKPYFEETEWVYLTRIDSDDMFNKKAIEIIQCYPPFYGALVCGKGLIYNSSTGELATWNPPTNPPFHTIIFEGKQFFDPNTHIEYYGNFKSHEDIPKVFFTQKLPDFIYCVTTHNPKNHISTLFNHPFRGELVNPNLINNYI